jgi:hypothetical protein
MARYERPNTDSQPRDRLHTNSCQAFLASPRTLFVRLPDISDLQAEVVERLSSTPALHARTLKRAGIENDARARFPCVLRRPRAGAHARSATRAGDVTARSWQPSTLGALARRVRKRRAGRAPDRGSGAHARYHSRGSRQARSWQHRSAVRWRGVCASGAQGAPDRGAGVRVRPRRTGTTTGGALMKRALPP